MLNNNIPLFYEHMAFENYWIELEHPPLCCSKLILFLPPLPAILPSHHTQLHPFDHLHGSTLAWQTLMMRGYNPCWWNWKWKKPILSDLAKKKGKLSQSAFSFCQKRPFYMVALPIPFMRWRHWVNLNEGSSKWYGCNGLQGGYFRNMTAELW